MNSQLNVKSKVKEGSEFYFELLLPIINSSTNLNKNINKNEIKIEIFEPKSEIICGIYNIVAHYLDIWKFNYHTIHDLDQINKDTNILIVCSKLFDEDTSKETLLKYKDVQIICIEGGDDSFECTNDKFHKIEQPMTGSALFDKIITLTHAQDFTLDDVLEQEDENSFDGNILIAEDNETNQMLISILMQSRGLTYKIVNNGQEAVDEALKNEYDIIFMDINMPVLDGLSATKILRNRYDYSKTIISLSANVIASDIKSFIEAGVDDTLNKPIVASELDNTLHKYLNIQKKVKKVITEFDDINMDEISKAISISNKEIILKLLQSFEKSAQSLIKDIQKQHLNEHIIHNIKGMSGNLRLNILYKLICQFEDEHKHWDETQKLQNSKIVIAHLKKAIEKIKLLS
ncbi:MAG: response regulator [Epsilonproteobacteria bacterium]|nr:response regulator [Campylobacterota bacterium]